MKNVSLPHSVNVTSITSNIKNKDKNLSSKHLHNHTNSSTRVIDVDDVNESDTPSFESKNTLQSDHDMAVALNISLNGKCPPSRNKYSNRVNKKRRYIDKLGNINIFKSKTI